LPVKKRITTFAPASRNTQCELNEAKKTEEHVPRHIELTAVPMQIGTNKIRVIESEDLRITTRPSVKN
jgi:hypothetical protein